MWLIVGSVLAVLIWLGVSMFWSDPAPAPAVSRPATIAVAPAVTPVEREAEAIPAGPPSPINEVIPDVPLSARNTITGTIVVSIRVTLDNQGTVIDTSTVVSGPSRYFQRLATEAVRKWTFTPADVDDQRTVQVNFYFRRSGTTADAEP